MAFATQFVRPKPAIQSLDAALTKLTEPQPLEGGGYAFIVPDDHDLRMAITDRLPGYARFIRKADGTSTRLEVTGHAGKILHQLVVHQHDKQDPKYAWSDGIVGLPKAYPTGPETFYPRVVRDSMRIEQRDGPTLLVRMDDQKSGFANVRAYQFPNAQVDTTHFADGGTHRSMVHSAGTTYKLTGDEMTKFILGYTAYKEQARGHGGVGVA